MDRQRTLIDPKIILSNANLPKANLEE